MTAADLIPFGNACQTLTIVLSLLAYIPQWRLLLREKSSRAFSLRAWLIWLISTALGLFYAALQVLVHNTGRALLISSGAGFVFILITIALIARYRAESNGVRREPRGQRTEHQRIPGGGSTPGHPSCLH